MAKLPIRDLAAMVRTSSYFKNVVDEGWYWRKHAEVMGREEIKKLHRQSLVLLDIINRMMSLVHHMQEMQEQLPEFDDNLQINIQNTIKYDSETKKALIASEANRKKILADLESKRWKEALKKICQGNKMGTPQWLEATMMTANAVV